MDGQRVVGVSVSYDGSQLHELRCAFIEAAKTYIGKDHTGMDDETQAGELYLDSLAVLPAYRRQGIAQRLLIATREPPGKEPTCYTCPEWDCWLIKAISTAKHYTPLSAFTM